MFDRIGNAKLFAKIDIKTGFHQIRMKLEDIEKTAFNIKQSRFEYLVISAGVCNAPVIPKQY